MHVNTKPSIVFFGNEKLATGITAPPRAFTSLLQAGYKIDAVVLSQKKPRQPNEIVGIQQVATRNNILIHYYETATTLQKLLETLPTTLGVVVAFGKIIRPAVLDQFPLGVINLHPSLLPAYRGPAPIEQAILDGKTKTGVSIMKLGEGVDDGPILSQQSLSIPPFVSKQVLSDRLHRLGTALLVETLSAYQKGTISTRPQSNKNATFTKKLEKKDSLVRQFRSAEQLERRIRAYAQWPTTTIEYNGLKLQLIDAIISQKVNYPAGQLLGLNHRLFLACEQGSLEIQRLKPAGKSEMSGIDFINGHAELKRG